MENNVKQFLEWMISVGCPTHLIPSESKIKEAIRAQVLPVIDIKKRFKAATEAQIIREKNLRVDLCKIKKWNFLIADKKEISWEYWQYDKLHSTRREIKRLENSIEELKSDYDHTKQQLDERNALKQKQKEKVKENITKMHFHEVNNMTLRNHVENILKTLDECDCAMNPSMNEKNFCDRTLPLKQLGARLEKYYAESVSNESKSENDEGLKTVLWSDISEILKSYPNSVVCNEIFKNLVFLLKSIKSSIEKDLKTSNHKKDPIYEYNIGLNDFLINRLRLFIHIKRYNKKLEVANKNYIDKFNSFHAVLANKIYHFSPQYISNYLKTLVVNAIYQGNIALLKDEYEKFQNCPLKIWVPLQPERIPYDVQDCREKMLSEVKNIETSIVILKHSSLKLQYALLLLRSQITGLKKQIAHSEKQQGSFRMDRWIEDTTLERSHIIPGEFVDGNQDLVLIQKIPVPDDLGISLPITEDDYTNLAQHILDSEAAILNILLQTETLGTQIGDLLNDAKKYCDFLIENPMRKYVPPERKVNGHTYKEYETEFMLHYRQIAGSE